MGGTSEVEAEVLNYSKPGILNERSAYALLEQAAKKG